MKIIAVCQNNGFASLMHTCILTHNSCALFSALKQGRTFHLLLESVSFFSCLPSTYSVISSSSSFHFMLSFFISEVYLLLQLLFLTSHTVVIFNRETPPTWTLLQILNSTSCSIYQLDLDISIQKCSLQARELQWRQWHENLFPIKRRNPWSRLLVNMTISQ